MQDISSHTTLFAVFGHPIGHSLSPVMHNRSIRALGMDALYLAFDVPPDELMDTLRRLGKLGFRGINLTVPLKEVAYQGVDVRAESAQQTRSVNTIEFLPDGSLKGHSTDGDGFLLALQEAFGVTVAGRNIFILGCGGAGRAVAITCATQQAASITLADIDAKRVEALQTELQRLRPDLTVASAGPTVADWVQAAPAADLVVQASPIGMKPDDASPLPAAAFRPGQLVFDLIYMYPETAVMRAAATAGARTSNGLGMLLHQGAKSFTIWTGQPAQTEAMREALEQAVYPQLQAKESQP